jgi:hypothetical protein
VYTSPGLSDASGLRRAGLPQDERLLVKRTADW